MLDADGCDSAQPLTLALTLDSGSTSNIQRPTSNIPHSAAHQPALASDLAVESAWLGVLALATIWVVGTGTSSSSSHSGTSISVFPPFFFSAFAIFCGMFGLFFLGCSRLICRRLSHLSGTYFFGILFEHGSLCSANSKLWAMLSMHLGVLLPRSRWNTARATIQMLRCSDVQTVQLVSRFSGESYDFRRRGITCIFRYRNRTTSVQMLDIIVCLANISALILRWMEAKEWMSTCALEEILHF